ncbi:hypothetical protein QZJ90_03405 [Acinetobacter baumannii]|nr:hypothetical protein [Acinetobacter baumannii]
MSDGNGLQLHVFANGRKTRIYSYRYNGKQKNITLGKYPQMTAIVAPSNAANLKKQLEKKPVQDSSSSNTKNKKVELDNSKLFRVVADKWFMFKKCGHAYTIYHRNLGAIRKYVFPTLGDKAVDDSNPDEILDIATKMQANGIIEMAKRIVRLIGQIFKFARRKLKLTKNNSTVGLVEELDDHKVKHMPRISILELPQLITDI